MGDILGFLNDMTLLSIFMQYSIWVWAVFTLQCV